MELHCFYRLVQGLVPFITTLIRCMGGGSARNSRRSRERLAEPSSLVLKCWHLDLCPNGCLPLVVAVRVIARGCRRQLLQFFPYISQQENVQLFFFYSNR